MVLCYLCKYIFIHFDITITWTFGGGALVLILMLLTLCINLLCNKTATRQSLQIFKYIGHLCATFDS